MAIQIVDLRLEDEQAIGQVAALLVDGFKEHWPQAWPTLERARHEVRASVGAERLSRVARAQDGAIVGWVGGIRHYDGHVWEVHPLVVRPDRQGQGIGRALVADLEERVRERGGLTLWVGTDDETGQTTLAGVDLSPDVWAHLATLRNLARHPYEFYQKLGFVLVGVLPDANGWGKPDLYLAKRVGGPGWAQREAGQQ